jgi:hypothetical protein
MAALLGSAVGTAIARGRRLTVHSRGAERRGLLGTGYALNLSKVLFQPDPRPFARPAGCTRLSQGTDQRFDVRAEMPQSLDSVGENSACSCVLVQEFLSFLFHNFLALQRVSIFVLRPCCCTDPANVDATELMIGSVRPW